MTYLWCFLERSSSYFYGSLIGLLIFFLFSGFQDLLLELVYTVLIFSHFISLGVFSFFILSQVFKIIKKNIIVSPKFDIYLLILAMSESGFVFCELKVVYIKFLFVSRNDLKLIEQAYTPIVLNIEIFNVFFCFPYLWTEIYWECICIPFQGSFLFNFYKI